MTGLVVAKPARVDAPLPKKPEPIPDGLAEKNPANKKCPKCKRAFYDLTKNLTQEYCGGGVCQREDRERTSEFRTPSQTVPQPEWLK